MKSPKSKAMPQKAAVREALLQAMRRTLAAMVEAARQTSEGATHEENRSEGDKDMRATEQSYLARGQAMRAEDLSEQLQRLETGPLRDYTEDDKIGAGALVRVLVDDAPRYFLVAGYGGGTVLQVDGAEVTVVTPSSPVGSLLCGKLCGDDFEHTTRGVRAEWVIDSVC